MVQEAAAHPFILVVGGRRVELWDTADGYWLKGNGVVYGPYPTQRARREAMLAVMEVDVSDAGIEQ